MADLQVVGPQWGALGTPKPFSGSISGSQRVNDAHARFMDALQDGRLFSWAKTATALSANSISLGATTTPIIGVWNPSTSNKWLVLLQAGLEITGYGASAVAPGAFMWAWSVGNQGVPTTGNAPWNRRTLTQQGSAARGYDLATALTNLGNNLVIGEAADFPVPLVANASTAAVLLGAQGVQNFDGSLAIPPGGVVALLNTVSTVTVNVSARLLWEEVPVQIF